MRTEDDQDPKNLDETITRVVSRTFVLEGVTFSWWAINDSPAFVTVSSQWFGTKAELTSSDPEAFARELAASLLSEHYRRAAALRTGEDDSANGGA